MTWAVGATSRQAALLAILLAAGALVGLGLWKSRTSSPSESSSPSAQPSVRVTGSAACASCHRPQYEQWLQSNHRHAMEAPTAESVRGDFGGGELRYFGRTSRFFRDGEAFRITTENQQGQPQTFTVAYTLGYRPLQQYLIDVGGGRLQPLPFAWDTRPKAEGGQRWFHLYPDENVTHDNPLFWTRPQQNWNHMCADCHTTGFAKNFDAAANIFRSTWNELGSGCESCHGAGSAHIEARRAGRVDTSDATLRRLGTHQEQIDQCGFCHARRIRLRDAKPHASLHETMLETWRPQLPHEGPYFADGQIQDEVFEIGSFLQSKMAVKGVRCTDCHDPHTGRPRAEGNALCTQCHLPEKFDVRQHHFHPPSSTGAQCVSCHMPTRTYMVVHERRDHRLAVPTPQLSDALGSPSPCTTCHTGRTARWAAQTIEQHLRSQGRSARDTSRSLGVVARALAREQTEAPQRLRQLVDDPLSTPIARATALAESRALTPDLMQVAQQQLAAADALVRLGAVQAAGRVPFPDRLAALAGSLRDRSTAVRREATGLLAEADTPALPAGLREELASALSEYRRWLSSDADRAEALTMLAGVQNASGDTAGARASYEQALRQDELSLVTLLNYADFHRAQGDDPSADRLLTRAAAVYPDAAAVHFALGLLRVRQQRHAEAVPELARAAQQAPQDSSYAYVYAVALYSTGQTDRALATLADARKRFPANDQIRSAIEAYCHELQRGGSQRLAGCGAPPGAAR